MLIDKREYTSIFTCIQNKILSEMIKKEKEHSSSGHIQNYQMSVQN